MSEATGKKYLITFNKALDIVLIDPPGMMGAHWDGACPSLRPQQKKRLTASHHPQSATNRTRGICECNLRVQMFY